MIVPFGRTLGVGNTGRDVVAVKRALNVWKAGAINNETQLYGPGMAAAVKGFQAAHKLAADGAYGKATHEKLAPFFDAYGAWLIVHTAVAKPPGPRERLVAAALALYNWHKESGRVHYTQGADRMTIVRERLKPPFRTTIYEDCSSSVTGYYWIAGLPDPNGRGYDGFGYTGTLAPNGKHVSVAFPGDLVFYGSPPTFEHVVIAVGDDVTKPTDRAVSHGGEGGPSLVPIDYRPPTAIRSYV